MDTVGDPAGRMGRELMSRPRAAANPRSRDVGRQFTKPGSAYRTQRHAIGRGRYAPTAGSRRARSLIPSQSRRAGEQERRV